MNFTQIEFLVFLCVTLVFAWASPTRWIRNSFLLLASYYFYAYWDVRFCVLLVISTLVDYHVAARMAQTSQASVKRQWLLLSLASNLGMLGFFKYFNFFIDTARPLVEAIGWHTQTLDIVLPVGISFYTFQTLSYTIDVYRGKLQPTRRLLDFALYVAFFPQLVAGPIVRASELLPQLASRPRFSRRRCYGGFQQLLRGAVKKVLIADRLAETVDIVFAGPELYSSVTVWIAVIAYAGQIYYDFSGYSDMAIGIAKMLGYRFPVNFRHPYLSRSMSEFWRRWHISLSSWLRDYLYISLGGSRGSRSQTYRNLMLTMTLGGLWHGAAMTFVVWGIWHGVALCVERITPIKSGARPIEGERDAVSRPRSILCVARESLIQILRWAAVMFIVLAGWVLFRSESIAQSWTVFRRMFDFQCVAITWLPPLTLLVMAIAVVEHIVWLTRFRRAMRLPFSQWYSPIATTILVWCLLLYAPRGFRPFVYFQF